MRCARAIATSLQGCRDDARQEEALGEGAHEGANTPTPKRYYLYQVDAKDRFHGESIDVLVTHVRKWRAKGGQRLRDVGSAT